MTDRNDPIIARRTALIGLSGLVAGTTLNSGTAAAQARRTPSGRTPPATPTGSMDLFRAAAAPSTPTGVVVTRSGRTFVFMPRFNDAVPYTVGEVAADGSVRPYPDAARNVPDGKHAADRLIHVPNGVVDGRERLWLLDAGLMASSGAPVPCGAKLVCVDLATDRVVRTIPLAPAVEPTSSLNDLRLDAEARRAFISDQGQVGDGAIVAVDLDNGRAVRRLAKHYSTASVDGIVKIVEGRQVMQRRRDGSTGAVKGGANGIAISPDGRRLFYAPLIGRHLYAVDTGALLDPTMDDAALAATVEDLGEKGLTGGLLCDPQGRVLLALQEHNAIGRRNHDGSVEIVASDPRLIWADTMWIEDDWLYISAAQVNRRPEFNRGDDLQRPPYAILRTRLPL
ncbi:sugar lactone lactonase YvrE [Sphingomonas jinjuensis]|uniref:Sugar lactone lactonase YvrE n=1 Tax=Sphingomonas jinjuensis TaxID=535907 RepID=A0A840FPC4_9SPHN|nr:L-dopachrome tautomerase-related protein [Sphingomonas jinjuensis]MBB4155738.1 sugar lactone lactonase YvrE [Sphingomonas jinjuensis]